MYVIHQQPSRRMKILITIVEQARMPRNKSIRAQWHRVSIMCSMIPSTIIIQIQFQNVYKYVLHRSSLTCCKADSVRSLRRWNTFHGKQPWLLDIHLRLQGTTRSRQPYLDKPISPICSLLNDRGLRLIFCWQDAHICNKLAAMSSIVCKTALRYCRWHAEMLRKASNWHKQVH